MENFICSGIRPWNLLNPEKVMKSKGDVGEREGGVWWAVG